LAPSGEVHIFRGTLLWERECFQQIRVTNFGQRDIRVPLAIEFAADYVDIFEVRGLERERRGRLLSPEVGERDVVLAYEGLDRVARRTQLHCSMKPSEISAERMSFYLDLPPGAEITLCISIRCEIGEPQPRGLVSFDDVERKNRNALASLARDECRI